MSGAGVTLETSRPDLFTAGQLVELYPSEFRDGAPVSRAAQTFRFLISSIAGSVLTGTMNFDNFANPDAIWVEKGWVIDGRNALGVISIDPGTTTPRAAIQAAINALNVAYLATGRPGVVVLPAGSFTMEDATTITIRSGVMVVGQGEDVTILNAPVTAATYTMFTTEIVADGATNLLATNASMGDETINATHGLVSGDYFLLTTTLGLIVEVGRVKSVTDATHFKPYEALHDTFTTAKGAQVKKITMGIRLGLKDVTLVGTNATGAAFGCNPNHVGLYSEFDIRTRGWVGNGVTGTGFVPSVVYGARLACDDEGSGSSAYAAIHPNYVCASVMEFWPHDGVSVACRLDKCQGNTIRLADGNNAGSRGFKFSGSCCNAIAVVTSDHGNGFGGGNNRGLVFADSSHHNVVGAARAQNSGEIDVWFAGDGANTDSAFSDSFNVIGALSTRGIATSTDPISGLPVASNIYVGASCVGNQIGAVTPGITINDQTRGIGLGIGNAPPIYTFAKNMDAWPGGPGATYAMAGAAGYYGTFDIAIGEAVVYNILIPRTYAASQVRAVLEWTNRTAGAGNISWRVYMGVAAEAADINSNLRFSFSDMTIAAPAQNIRKRTAHDQLQAVAAGDVLTVIVQRLAAGDTLGANDIGLVGVELIPA
jgi:hypothetical protein